MATKSSDNKPESKPITIKFDYIKSHQFRVIHSDGVFGGLSPSGKINIGFWNQRMPFPQRTVQVLDEIGHLGDEIKEERVARDAIVREIEANIVMDIDVAKSFLDWLGGKIVEAEKAIKDQQAREGK